MALPVVCSSPWLPLAPALDLALVVASPRQPLALSTRCILATDALHTPLAPGQACACLVRHGITTTPQTITASAEKRRRSAHALAARSSVCAHPGTRQDWRPLASSFHSGLHEHLLPSASERYVLGARERGRGNSNGGKERRTGKQREATCSQCVSTSIRRTFIRRETPTPTNGVVVYLKRGGGGVEGLLHTPPSSPPLVI